MQIAAIVLAAGGARRMGQLKQVLPCRGEPLVRRAVRAALDASLSSVLVVVGAEADRVLEALAGLPVQTVLNHRWAEGQSTSVRAGILALPKTAEGAVFLLADQPFVSPALLRALADGLESGARAVAPEVEGHLTSPVAFSAKLFPELLKVKGDRGGRALFPRYPPRRIPWHDPRIAVDVDSRQDYEHWCR